MPAGFDRDTAGDAAAREEIQHRRARIGQRAHDALDQLFRLLRRMSDALLGIAVEPRNSPDIRRVDTLVEILGIEALVALVDLERLRIEPGTNRIEIEIISW